MEENQNFLKDYTEKIKNKISENTNPEDINNLIIFLNYCFLNKNNFFIPNFSKRMIKSAVSVYNKLKTNILTPSIDNIFNDLNIDDIKLLKFMLSNFLNNYDNIITNNKVLCDLISKDSLKNIIFSLNLIK